VVFSKIFPQAKPLNNSSSFFLVDFIIVVASLMKRPRHLCSELCYFREFEAARQLRALQAW